MKKNPNIADANIVPEEAYVTWTDENLEDKRTALTQASKSLDEFSGIERSYGGYYYPRDFSDLAPGPTSGRPGLTRRDYDTFRPEESIPRKIKAIIQQSDMVYNRVGLVKNVIDLMGDFASQGVRISHPNKRIQNFYQNWFKKVRGVDRSERFLNNLYRLGNVVINRQTAKISVKVEKNMYKSSAKTDMSLTYNDISPEVERKEIPWKYTFIDPVLVDIVGGPLASFVGKKVYSIVLPASLRKMINAPKSDAERSIIAQLPESVIEAAKTKKPYILDPNKSLVFYYKKDDWKAWAYPMIYSIMDDINVIEKLKLADLAALDGAISNIRIFKLGSLDHKIAPTPAAASKLSNILQNNVGGGTMDLVWGPDIELIESKTSVHQFLGEAKYTPHLNSIYAGLGIPPTLTGTYGAAGTTNNFISLKTLTQRLQYGRRVLLEFWNNEIVMIQKAMGFKEPAIIEFDRMDLSNEEAEKALLLQLADRNIVSDEYLQTVFGINTNMEKSRIKNEERERENGKMSPKAGPYYDGGTFENGLRKIALQMGLATPSQVELGLKERLPGEKTVVEVKTESEIEKIKSQPQKGVPGEGRPMNSNDTEQRKQREFKPQTGVPQNASIMIWGLEAQEKIADIMNPYLLDFYNKKNIRSLSSEEYREAEETKTKIFLSLEPNVPITQETVLSKLNTMDSIDNKRKQSACLKFIKSMHKELSRNMTAEELKYTKAYFCSMV
jgi:hypothetical protein